jgi:hypothetical protein
MLGIKFKQEIQQFIVISNAIGKKYSYKSLTKAYKLETAIARLFM